MLKDLSSPLSLAVTLYEDNIQGFYRVPFVGRGLNHSIT
jgi:hypothetical protein